MYAVCMWALLLRQHEGMKPNSDIMWVFLRSSSSIFPPFSNGTPPNSGQQLLSFSHKPIFTHRRYNISSLLYCISSRLPSGNSSNAMQREGCEGGYRLSGVGVSPLIDVGDIIYPVFLSQVNNISVPSQLLGSINEARSQSWPGSGVYWWMQSAPLQKIDPRWLKSKTWFCSIMLLLSYNYAEVCKPLL